MPILKNVCVILAATNITRLNKSSITVDNIKNLKAYDFNRVNYGLLGGLGIDIPNFTIGARYNYGIHEIGERDDTVAGQATRNSKNSVIGLYYGLSCRGHSHAIRINGKYDIKDV